MPVAPGGIIWGSLEMDAMILSAIQIPFDRRVDIFPNITIGRIMTRTGFEVVAVATSAIAEKGDGHTLKVTLRDPDDSGMIRDRLYRPRVREVELPGVTETGLTRVILPREDVGSAHSVEND